ncbi:MAG: kynurenine 3-monooxygenase, partial [Robiginitalea sp.]
GMNAGFEDISQLITLMEAYGDDWERIFSTYQENRKPNADAIAELSYRNFVEMSTRTADPEFLLQKKIENHFAAQFPGQWIPAYSRVTFSDQPYSEALAIGDRQEAIMKEIMKMPQIEKLWDQPVVSARILQLLKES